MRVYKILGDLCVSYLNLVNTKNIIGLLFMDFAIIGYFLLMGLVVLKHMLNIIDMGIMCVGSKFLFIWFWSEAKVCCN